MLFLSLSRLSSDMARADRRQVRCTAAARLVTGSPLPSDHIPLPLVIIGRRGARRDT
jgi:hypothetical protein